MEINHLIHRGRREAAREAAEARGDRRGSDRRGNGYKRRQEMAMGAGHFNTHTEEKRQTSSLKANGVPMKMLIKEEMSTQGKVRRNLPGLIARLMGLDTLPPEPVNEPGACSSKHKPETCSQKLLKDYPGGSGVIEPECKDVFEVIEASQIVRPKIPPVDVALSKFRSSEVKKDFAAQKFLSSKSQYTNGRMRYFSRVHDVSDSFGSSEDFFRGLQESNQMFDARGSVDVDSVFSATETNHITVLKSSKIRKSKNAEFYEANKKCENCTAIRRHATSGMGRQDSVHRQSGKDQSPNASARLAKSEQKPDSGSLPTRIVVLKPSIRKVRCVDDSSPLQYPVKTFPSGHRRHRSSGSCNFLSENRDLQSLELNTGILRNKTQNFGKVSIETEKPQRMHNSKKHYEEHDFVLAENIERRQVKTNSITKVRVPDTLYHLDESGNNHLSLPSHSMESFVTREARKHLSKQWSVWNGCKDGGYLYQGPSTLAEMLALSDGEAPASDLLNSQAMEDYPLGISSRDGWKDIWPRKLTRSRSLPVSSTFLVNVNSNHDQIHVNDCMLDDAMVHSDSSHMKEPELRHMLDSPATRDLLASLIPLDEVGEDGNFASPHEIASTSHEVYAAENDIACSEPHISFYDAVPYVDNIPTTFDANKNLTGSAIIEMPQSTVLSEYEDVPYGANDLIILSKRLVGELSEVCPSGESSSPSVEFPVAPKDDEQPSPISVLDSLDEEMQSKPGCFEKVNAELQSLRLQLQLLRSESANTCMEGSETLSDEEMHGSFIEFEGRSNIPESSTFDEDQDFSYILRILTDSGLQGAQVDEIPDICHLLESPIDPILFLKLEKLFESSAWLRGERKLLFDLVNCVITELLTPGLSPSYCMQTRQIFKAPPNRSLQAEDVWISLVKMREDSICNVEESFIDSDWLNVADDIDRIVGDVERMVRDEFLNEIICELALVE